MTDPTLYSIDIVEQQKLEQPRLFSVEIVDKQTLEQPRLFSVEIVETHIPISVPLIYEINVSWLDYIVDDSNALFSFGGI